MHDTSLWRRLHTRATLFSGWTWVAAASLIGFEALDIVFGAMILAPELLPLVIVALALTWVFRDKLQHATARLRARRRASSLYTRNRQREHNDGDAVPFHHRRSASMSVSAAAVGASESLRRRSREALTALAAQFLLGMAANLIGEPEGGFATVVSWIVLILHILIGIGLIVISIRLFLAAQKAGAGQRLALWGIIVIAVTFLAGVATIVLDSDWASYVMAAGFLGAAVLYGGTFFASYHLENAPRTSPSSGD